MSAQDERIAAAEVHKRLLDVERAARAALVYAIDTAEGQTLRDALHRLDGTRSAIKARRRLRQGAGL